MPTPASTTAQPSRHQPAPFTDPASTGGRLVSADGHSLPFQGGSVDVDAASGLCRVVLRQRFVNPHDHPLRVTWQLPLPSDAAVAGYAFELDGQRILGQVEPKAKAREHFEEAILDGRSAALLEQDRSSLFSQELGNLPPGATVVCELRLDQRLSWKDGGWSWRFPTVVAPRFLGESGRVPDADRVSVDVSEATEDSAKAPRMTLKMRVRDSLTGPVHSPTHSLSLGHEITLDDRSGTALDRDIVVRWSVASPTPGLSLDLARADQGRAISQHSCGLLSLVPPAAGSSSAELAELAELADLPRDLVLLLDTSGSMAAAPLQQAVDVSCALIDSLQDQDQLQIIEFSVRPRAWKKTAVAATTRHKRAATAWVRALRAGGGTQMKAGILAALDCLRDEAQRQVILVTDGLIGFEREIVSAVAQRLPRGCRVHTLGIGSAVNRSLLTPVARAGGGIEAIVGLTESPQDAARDLVAATASPQVVDLELSGSALVQVAHHRIPDLLAGRPARIALRLHPQGGELLLTGHTAAGEWRQTVVVPAQATGQGSPAVLSLVGRELAAEAELRAAQGDELDALLEQLGVDYQIATRMTSWVAISEQITVDPSQPTRREHIPQALPQGMSVAGLGLRAAQPARRGLKRRRASRLRRDEWVEYACLEPSTHALEPAARPTPAPLPLAEPEVKADFDSFSQAMPSPAEAAGFDDEDLYTRSFDVRVVLAQDHRLVLELRLSPNQDLVWRVPSLRVEARMRDGSTVVLQLDPAASTQSGWIQGGEVLRLVLVKAQATDAPPAPLAELLPDIMELLVVADSTSGDRLLLHPVSG